MKLRTIILGQILVAILYFALSCHPADQSGYERNFDTLIFTLENPPRVCIASPSSFGGSRHLIKCKGRDGGE